MFNIAVLDDDTFFLEKMHCVLNQHDCFNVRLFNNPTGFLAISQKQKFDLLFLDIEMPHMNGLDVLNNLQANNCDTLIVFITNNSNYMVNCFNKNVVGFIPKENFNEHIHVQIEKIIKLLSPQKLLFETEFDLKDFLENDVILISLELRKIWLLLSNGMKVNLHYKTINDVINILNTSSFFQINRSTIVNLSKITHYSNNDIFLLTVKQPLQISKYRKADFMTALFDFNLGRRHI